MVSKTIFIYNKSTGLNLNLVLSLYFNFVLVFAEKEGNGTSSDNDLVTTTGQFIDQDALIPPDAKDCLKFFIGLNGNCLEMKIGVMEAVQKYKIANLVRDICTNYYPCIEIITATYYEQCFSDEQREYFQIKARKNNALRKYICNNNAETIKNLAAENFATCEPDKTSTCPLHGRADVKITEMRKYPEMFNREYCMAEIQMIECEADKYKYCADEIFYKVSKDSKFIPLRETPCLPYVPSGAVFKWNLNSLFLMATCFACIISQDFYI